MNVDGGCHDQIRYSKSAKSKFQTKDPFKLLVLQHLLGLALDTTHTTTRTSIYLEIQPHSRTNDLRVLVQYT